MPLQAVLKRKTPALMGVPGQDEGSGQFQSPVTSIAKLANGYQSEKETGPVKGFTEPIPGLCPDMLEPRETDYLFFNVEYQDRATSSRFYIFGNKLPSALVGTEGNAWLQTCRECRRREPIMSLQQSRPR